MNKLMTNAFFMIAEAIGVRSPACSGAERGEDCTQYLPSKTLIDLSLCHS